jgi:hypothetical protein
MRQLTARNTARKLDTITASHSSTEVSNIGLATWTAALFTNASSRSVKALAWEKIASRLPPLKYPIE